MNAISGARALVLGLSVVWLAMEGCGSSSDLGPPPLAVDKAPSGSGDQQTGALGTPLANALRVIVTRDGAPESRVSVNWFVTVGSVDPATATTGADGIGATTWTLGAVAGTQTAQAAVSGATNSPVSFTATATPVESPPSPPPVSPLALAQAPTGSGDGQTGPVGTPLGQPLRVMVTRDGVAQAGVTVVWKTGAGSLDPASSMTGGDGIASSSWTLGPNSGSQTATAEVIDATGSPVTFTATATATTPPPPTPPPPPLPPPPPPSGLGVTVGNIFFKSGRNGSTNPAVDTVAVNGTVTWTWKSTGTARHSVESTGSPSFTNSAVLTGDGQTYSFTFTRAGVYTYDCAIHGSNMTGRIVVK